MNKIYKLIIVGILLNTNAFGQIEKGKMLIGGSFDFISAGGGSTTIFSPNFGYMITDNIMGGVLLNTGGGSTSVAPFVRYYKPLKDQVFGFGHVGYSLSSPNILTVGVGVNYFLFENISIEPFLGFQRRGNITENTSYGTLIYSKTQIGLNIGLQFFF